MKRQWHQPGAAARRRPSGAARHRQRSMAGRLMEESFFGGPSGLRRRSTSERRVGGAADIGWAVTPDPRTRTETVDSSECDG